MSSRHDSRIAAAVDAAENREAEVDELRRRLKEAEETIAAIQSGEVDAFLVEAPEGPRVYTLETADRPYRQLVEHMQQGALVLDGTTVLFANRHFTDILGLPRDRLRGGRLLDHAVPEHRTALESVIRDGCKGGGRTELLLQHADGRKIPILLTISPLPKENDTILCVAIVTDLSHQKAYEELQRTERALRESEERFRFVAETIPSIAWTAAPDGTLTYVNRRWREYSGLSESEAGNWMETILRPDDREPVVAKWRDHLRRGTEYQMESRLRRHDGVYRWFLTRAAPLKDEHGKVLSWFGVTMDIHDQKEVESVLRDTDRRKDDFLAMLSHELRNPLAPIRNAVQILKSAAIPPDEQQRVTEMMDRQLDHLIRLVDDLLEVSRIGRGMIELRKEWADLGSIIRGAVETSQPFMQTAGHTLTLHMPDEPVFLVADAVRLQQVLGNLLNNAAKFTDPGGRIWLNVARDQTEVVITVRDTGRGISPEMLPQIFGMFVQVEDAPPVRRPGLGIGLTLARRLVEMHGGRIEARSSGLNRGSEFIVYLPVGKLDAEGVEHPKPKQVRFVPGDHPRPCRVLVVDDHEDSTASLGILLRLMGHDVRVANDGASAIEAACVFKPEVILLDIGMPIMDGYEVARRLRREPACDGVRLIALTGYGRDEDRQRSRSAGFDDHLVKPVNLESLRQLLNGTRP